MAIDPAYAEALDALHYTINKATGISHDNDFDKTVELFNELLKRGRRVAHTDQFYDHLRPKGDLTDEQIADIVHVYSALERAQDITPGTSWQTKFIDDLVKKPKA